MSTALKLAALAAVMAMIGGALLYMREQGAEAEHAKQDRQTIQDTERRSENNEAVRNLPDCDALNEFPGRVPIDCAP